jgi:hypothetical protein
MGIYVEITFGDLSYSKQESLIEDLKKSLLEKYEESGKKALEQEWHVKSKTWQEAYCRDADIDWEMWNDLDENSEEFQNYNWKYAIEEYAEKEAEKNLFESFHHLEVEVEV